MDEKRYLLNCRLLEPHSTLSCCLLLLVVLSKVSIKCLLDNLVLLLNLILLEPIDVAMATFGTDCELLSTSQPLVAPPWIPLFLHFLILMIEITIMDIQGVSDEASKNRGGQDNDHHTSHSTARRPPRPIASSPVILCRLSCIFVLSHHPPSGTLSPVGCVVSSCHPLLSHCVDTPVGQACRLPHQPAALSPINPRHYHCIPSSTTGGDDGTNNASFLHLMRCKSCNFTHQRFPLT